MCEKDEKVDAMLRGYFRDTLDGQCGRSERQFRQFLGSQSRTLWRQRSFLIGAFVSGLAASVAVLWASPLFHSVAPRGPSGVPAPSGSLASAQPVIERVVSTKLSDEGVVMLDEQTPVRVYRRQAVEQTRWFDEHDDMKAQEVTPRDDLLFVKLVTY